MKLWDIATIKDILNKFDFHFSKSLGQNFIIDEFVCPRMAGSLGDNPNIGVLEIGPGIGVLTRELAKRYKKVVSVEIDSRLIPVLNYTVGEFDNVKIINSDILKTDLTKLISDEFSECDEVCVCANLPYYITSDIIMYILEKQVKISSMTVMVQKEAAQRICAELGTRDSGSISIAVRYYAVPKIIFNVGRGCFMPAPKVDSCVIKIDMSRKNFKKVNNKNAFFKVVRAAYCQRRKNLLNSLSAGLGISKIKASEILLKAGVDASKRAEQLSFEEFCLISDFVFS